MAPTESLHPKVATYYRLAGSGVSNGNRLGAKYSSRGRVRRPQQMQQRLEEHLEWPGCPVTTIRRLKWLALTLSSSSSLILQILQAFGTWAAKASIEQGIKSHFTRDIEKLKALLQTRSAHEQELIASYVQKSWDLCEQTTVITHQTCQLSAKIGTEVSRGRQEGMTEEQILYSVNAFFQKESPPIVESTMLLKKAYGLLPSDVIERLQEYESTVWQVLMGHDWALLSKVLDQNDQLLTSLRNINAGLLEGTIALPALLRGAPQSGFVPGYMRTAVARMNESSNAS